MNILLVADPVSSETLYKVLASTKVSCAQCPLGTFAITTATHADIDEHWASAGVDFVLIEFQQDRAQDLLRVDDVLEARHIPHAFYTRTEVDPRTTTVRSPFWPGNGIRMDLISKVLDHYTHYQQKKSSPPGTLSPMRTVGKKPRPGL